MSKNKTTGFGAEDLSYIHSPDLQVESLPASAVAAKENQRVKRNNALTNIAAKMLPVIWLSVLLGLLIEIVLVVIALWFDRSQSLKPFIADLVQKISWSTIVCSGLGMGTAVSRLPIPIAGLAGLFAAPLAFQIARSLHKGTAEALSIMAGSNELYPPLLIGLIKGFEYACLGLIIVWLGKQAWGKALAHIGAGLWIGIVFGSLILILIFGASPKPIAVADFVARAVNEVFFPVGCALVVFVSNTLGKMTNESTTQ